MTSRNKKYMSHPLQTKYLLSIVLAMLLPTLLIGFCLYHIVFYLLANQMVFPEAIGANLFPVIEQVNKILIITLPILAAVVIWFGLAISHRFAGPINRLENGLDKLLEGDYQHRIRLRKNDDLLGIASKINLLAEKLEKK